MAPNSSGDGPTTRRSRGPGVLIRNFLGGVSISLPLILTVVILLWLGQGVYSYIVRPISVSVQWAYAGSLNESVGFDPGKFRLLDASEYEGVGKNNGIEREDLPKLYKLREDQSREYVVINVEAGPFEACLL